MKGKLVGDEPYYDSFDCSSLEYDDGLKPLSNNECEGGQLRGRRVDWWYMIHYASLSYVRLSLEVEIVTKFKITLTKYALKKGIKLDKYVNNLDRVNIKYKASCPWMLFTSKKEKNSIVKTYNPRHKFHRTKTNFLCSSKYLVEYLKDGLSHSVESKGKKFKIG